MTSRWPLPRPVHCPESSEHPVSKLCRIREAPGMQYIFTMGTEAKMQNVWSHGSQPSRGKAARCLGPVGSYRGGYVGVAGRLKADFVSEFCQDVIVRTGADPAYRPGSRRCLQTLKVSRDRSTPTLEGGPGPPKFVKLCVCAVTRNCNRLFSRLRASSFPAPALHLQSPRTSTMAVWRSRVCPHPQETVGGLFDREKAQCFGALPKPRLCAGRQQQFLMARHPPLPGARNAF